MKRCFKLVTGFVVVGVAFSALIWCCCISLFNPATACHQRTADTCFVKISKATKICDCKTTIGVITNDNIASWRALPVTFINDLLTTQLQPKAAPLEYARLSYHYPPETIQNIAPVYLQKSILRI